MGPALHRWREDVASTATKQTCCHVGRACSFSLPSEIELIHGAGHLPPHPTRPLHQVQPSTRPPPPRRTRLLQHLPLPSTAAHPDHDRPDRSRPRRPLIVRPAFARPSSRTPSPIHNTGRKRGPSRRPRRIDHFLIRPFPLGLLQATIILFRPGEAKALPGRRGRRARVGRRWSRSSHGRVAVMEEEERSPARARHGGQAPFHTGGHRLEQQRRRQRPAIGTSLAPLTMTLKPTSARQRTLRRCCWERTHRI